MTNISKEELNTQIKELLEMIPNEVKQEEWSNKSTFSGSFNDLSNRPETDAYMSGADREDIAKLKTDTESLFQSVSSGKTLIANATTLKGVPTAADASFATMASNITSIPTLKSHSQDFIVKASGTSGSVETNITFNAGFTVEWAIIIYHDFYPTSIEKTGAAAIYAKWLSLTNPLVRVGGYTNNASMRGAVIPNLMSNSSLRTRIEGNTVIVQSTYYNTVNIPAQDLKVTVYAFG